MERIPVLTENQRAAFWAKVDKRGPDDCWPWKEGRYRQGYGSYHMLTGKRQALRAHRIAFALSVPFDSRLHVLHTCDSPPCCNPAHLYAGTQSQNIQDSYDRGRKRPMRGERSGNSKLTEVQVNEIRLLAEGGLLRYEIAEMYEVTSQNVSDVVNRKTWV